MGYQRRNGISPGDPRARNRGAVRVRPLSQVQAPDHGPEELRGIGMSGGPAGASDHRPRIAAFIWAEREDVPPTLPFGRWKKAS